MSEKSAQAFATTSPRAQWISRLPDQRFPQESAGQTYPTPKLRFPILAWAEEESEHPSAARTQKECCGPRPHTLRRRETCRVNPVHLRRMERVIIGIDDTDTPEAGATWALTHNIAREVEDDNSRYLSHTITQLFPVAQRTKNCVAVAIEFATTEPDVLIARVQKLVEQYTLSDKTGMVVFRGFDPSPLEAYAGMVKRGEVTLESMESINHYLDIRIGGPGIIGAAAAISFYTRFDEALELCGNP